jgi:predicted site-specific integrase-resolvase
LSSLQGYISAREASYKWGVSERRVHQYCQAGRIPGVSHFGRSWVIPADAIKPSAPRKKTVSERQPIC